MSTAQLLLAAVDAFLRETGMAETTFGLRALNDGKFVSRLRGGSGITVKTNDRVLSFIASERDGRAQREHHHTKRASRRKAA